jgi:hypothetical protein
MRNHETLGGVVSETAAAAGRASSQIKLCFNLGGSGEIAS